MDRNNVKLFANASFLNSAPFRCFSTLSNKMSPATMKDHAADLFGRSPLVSKYFTEFQNAYMSTKSFSNPNYLENMSKGDFTSSNHSLTNRVIEVFNPDSRESSKEATPTRESESIDLTSYTIINMPDANENNGNKNNTLKSMSTFNFSKDMSKLNGKCKSSKLFSKKNTDSEMYCDTPEEYKYSEAIKRLDKTLIERACKKNCKNKKFKKENSLCNGTLPYKDKDHIKSPNSNFYRQLIEELSSDKKSDRKLKNRSSAITEEPMDPTETEIESKEDYIIIKHPYCDTRYEIRFSDPVRSKPRKRFRKRTVSVRSDNTEKDTLRKYNQLNAKLPRNKLSETIETPKRSEINIDEGFVMLQNHFSEIDSDTDTSTDFSCYRHRPLVRQVSDCESEDSYVVFDDSDSIKSSESQESLVQSPVKGSDLMLHYLRNRCRNISECESEDSFIVFADDDRNLADCDPNDDYASDCSSDSESCDTVDHCVRMLRMKPVKKVQFNSELCTVHPMVKWSYAYQHARKGQWEEAARDRGRFQSKIQKFGDIICPVLDAQHRNKIYKSRFENDTA